MQHFIYNKKLYARDLIKEAIEAGKILKHCTLLSLVSNGHIILGLNSVYADVRKNKQCLECNTTDFRESWLDTNLGLLNHTISRQI